jgi:flagella basal body P-ring formation protein FlgA
MNITQRLVITACTLLMMTGVSAAEFETVERIRAAAEQHARRQLPQANEVIAVNLDQRLRLKRCGTSLLTHSGSATNRAGLTVQVSCRSPHPWKIYVPVRASSTLDVVVAKQGMAANQVLSATDLRLEARNTASLPYGFFTDPNAILGARLRRTVASGTVLVPAALEAHKLVRRGQQVTLMDGVKAQRIQVKTPSARIIEGAVESADVVRIGG